MNAEFAVINKRLFQLHITLDCLHDVASHNLYDKRSNIHATTSNILARFYTHQAYSDFPTPLLFDS